MSPKPTVAHKTKGNDVELSKFSDDGSRSAKGRHIGQDARNPQRTPQQLSKTQEYTGRLPTENSSARLKGSPKLKDPTLSSKHDSAVSLTSIPAARKRDSVPTSKASKQAVPVEKVRTPRLTLQRLKRTSTSSLQPAPSDHVASFSRANEIGPPPERLPPPPQNPQIGTGILRHNPKAARVRAGTSLSPIPPTSADNPTAADTITLPPHTLCSPPRNSAAPSTTSQFALGNLGTNNTKYTPLIANDLDHWTYIQQELAARDIPLSAVSPPQMTDLMALTDPTELSQYLDKLALIHQSDAFEHVVDMLGDCKSNPQMYSFRYTHSAPLGEVYTYKPPFDRDGDDAEGGGGGGDRHGPDGGKKTIGQLVRIWGRSSCARYCKMSYAILAGLGVIGAIVAVCYFRIGESKKSFAHET